MNTYDWLAIIAVVGTVSGLLIKKWLLHHIEYSVKNRYEKEIETHKANLKRDYDVQVERLKAELAEKHFQFSHVFEKTATAITEIYVRFRHYENAVAEFRCAGKNPERQEVLLTEANRRRKELWDYVELNKIFLPKKASDTVARLYIAYYATTTTAMLTDKELGGPTKREELDKWSNDAKNFLALLEEEFQRILGFPGEP